MKYHMVIPDGQLEIRTSVRAIQYIYTQGPPWLKQEPLKLLGRQPEDQACKFSWKQSICNR